MQPGEYAAGRDMPEPFDTVLARVRAALKGEGFGVMAEIDVQATLREKLGVERGRYVILGACNPPLANKGLTTEPDLGVLLPCNLVVYENGETTRVAAVNAGTMLGIVGNPALDAIAGEVQARLARVLEKVRTEACDSRRARAGVRQDETAAAQGRPTGKEELVAEVKTLTDESFDKEIGDTATPMIVDFWAPWCGPCRMVGPVIEEIANDHDGKVVVGKVNVDENPATASKFGIMSIPTIILFKDGEPAKKVIGARSKADFEREFELA